MGSAIPLPNRSRRDAPCGGLVSLGFAALFAFGCTPLRTDFTCASDQACVQGTTQGTCEPNGACSFPDATCAGSARRYAARSPGGVSGQCVPQPCGAIDQACCFANPSGPCSPHLACESGTCGGCIVQLVAGSAHACALKGDEVYCWGQNDRGQLGTGDLADSLAPRPVLDSSGVPLTNVIAISAGESHTCAIRRDGTLLCWGDGDDGRLGVGTTVPSNPVPQLVALTTVAAVAAGGRHTCAALKDGRSYCWGANESGQLGEAGAGASAPEPVGIASGAQLTSAKILVAGEAFTCALDGMNGRLCWGANQVGQFGDGTTQPVDLATPIAGAQTALAAGGALLCLLDASESSGVARCTGANDYGEAGQPPSTSVLAPLVVPGTARLTDLAVGREHACARRDDGVVLCWGRDELGELGDGAAVSRNQAAPISGAVPMGRVAAGRSFSCAATSDGVSCWGDDDHGQLGDGLTTSRPVAAPSLLTCP